MRVTGAPPSLGTSRDVARDERLARANHAGLSAAGSASDEARPSTARTFRNIRGAILSRWWRVLLVMWLALVAVPAAAQDFPKFSGLVVDAANVIPDDREAALRQKLEALQQQTKRQLVVATVPSLNGGDIDDYANRLFRAWGIGLKGADNGALLLVAPNEHQVRIEVGYGLEPWITDALSGVVIARDITPRFKAGDMPGGIDAGVDALATQLSLPQDQASAKATAAEADFDKAHQRRGSGGGGLPIGLIFWGVILMVVVLPMLARRRGGAAGQRWTGGGGGSNWPIILWGIANELGNSRGGGGGWGGGGSSGGGSDGSWGGGFTGGGGGSSGGGGASGGW